jgi:hypothetical protein
MRVWLLAAGALAAIVALGFARPHPTPGPPMRDFEAYYAAGTLWSHGGDPYSQAIWPAEQPLSGVDAQRYEALPFVGPPAVLPLFALVARLPFDAANALWRALLIAALAAIALLALRMAHHRITPFTFLAIAIAALGFGPLTSALALGQIALPAFACAVMALSWQPAAFFAWAQPNVALALVPQLVTRRALGFLAAAALFGAACLLSVGTSGLERYAGVLHEHAWAEQFSAIQLTPASIAYGFGASPQIAAVIGTAAAIAAIGCWTLLIRADSDPAARFAASCALLPLAMPFFHEHDLLVVFVPAVLYATRGDGRTWPLAAGGAMLAATDWLGLAQRPDGTLQTLLLAGAFGAGLAALAPRPHPRMLVVPGAVLALIGIASLAAHAHPAPVWPDAMGALPRDIASMDISHAWNAEQRATGLFGRDAIWSALRLLSLAGCALTATAIAVSSRYPAGSKKPLPAQA